jgi:hypothetical protein
MRFCLIYSKSEKHVSNTIMGVIFIDIIALVSNSTIVLPGNIAMSHSRIDKISVMLSIVVLGTIFGTAFFRSPKVESKMESTIVAPSLETEPKGIEEIKPKFETTIETPKVIERKKYSLPTFVSKIKVEGIIDTQGIKGDASKITYLDGKEYITLSLDIPEKTVYQFVSIEGTEGSTYGYPNSIVILENGKEYFISKVVEE